MLETTQNTTLSCETQYCLKTNPILHSILRKQSISTVIQQHHVLLYNRNKTFVDEKYCYFDQVLFLQ